MVEHPLARRRDLVAIQSDDGLIVLTRDGLEIARLSALEVALWRAADGQTTVADMASRLSTDPGADAGQEEVWRALDRLGDAGLLEARPTPPGSLPVLSRRKLLTQAAGGGLASVAAVAASGIALAAAAAATKAEAATRASRPEPAGGRNRVEAVKARRRRKHRHP